MFSPALKKISSMGLSVDRYWFTSIRTQIFSSRITINYHSAGMFLCVPETHILSNTQVCFLFINKTPESELSCSSSLGLESEEILFYPLFCH